MTDALLHPDDLEGWRGEIRDSEIVKTHEEALEEEQGRSAEHDGQTGDDAAPAPAEQDEAGEGAELVGPEDEADEPAEEPEEAEEYDEPEEYDEADGPIDDEDGEPEAAEEAEEYEDADVYDETADYNEPADEPNEAERTRRGEPVGARSGRRR